MAREAGAKKVFFASAAPPIRFQNVYGIDMAATSELIAHQKDENQIADYIGADWLVYQDLEDLILDEKSDIPALKGWRWDVFGKDAIKLKDGAQVTEFHEGILPWALRNPVAIVFDEYDAGRADVMFVIQRVLEHDGKLTLMDQNEIITPNSYFRL